MGRINDYVKQILQRIEVNEQEYQALHIEMTAYLHERKELYRSEGYSEDQATEMALKKFGDSKCVGQSLASSLFLQRKKALYSLLLFSLAYTVITTVVLSYFNNYHPLRWLLFTSLLATITFALIKRPLFIARHRIIFILFCFLYLIAWFYGLFLIDVVPNSMFTWLHVVLSLLYLISIIINMILGALFQPINKHFSDEKLKTRRLIVISNLISGLIICSYVLSFIAGSLIFLTFNHFARLFPVLIILLLWVGSLLLSGNRPKLAWLTTIIQATLAIYVLSIWFRIILL
ncbi:hypothetical protein SAMN04488134_10285 [Amphibacillus marinus]|uniref:Uncharacterized protein n=1 Tax=Amphibacillus marinus TaxID=872970 RepID=A0A1H8JVF8_9BACI|nr:hypothetical protein [Amphibacillus marinus]SEN84703.1 hypothetical protein SAMN04488134_10285 [Amphibacillus marinus]